MCLAGPPMPDYSNYQSPAATRPKPPPGPASPPDQVNKISVKPTEIEEVKKTTSSPSQSSKNPGMY